jgi:manganese transport protein
MEPNHTDLEKPAARGPTEGATRQNGSNHSLWQFVRWMGPSLMVSMAYMDPGNYGTDLAAGAGFRYDLLWAVWLANLLAMLLQYLSGKLGIASGRDLPELVRSSLGGKRRYVVPYWLAAEAAAAATDLAEYLGTVVGLNLLFGIPLIYASVFGALDVILLLTMMGRRFRLIEQYFALLITVLVIGIFYNLVIVGVDPVQFAYHSVTPVAPTNDAFLIVVGIIGATVMPHALFVHSWLSKNKMDLLGRRINGKPGTSAVADLTKRPEAGRAQYSVEERQRVRKLHRNETIVTLTIAGVVNAGILLVAIPFWPNTNITISAFVKDVSQLYSPVLGIVFVLTLLASGLLSSALGTIAGQVIMEGLIGKHWNVWARRIVTRFINVFPTTLAISLGYGPLVLLVYSQVILSLMIPLPMIPLVYYTSKRKFMGELVNRRITFVLAIATVTLIVAFNAYLLVTFI